MFAGFGTAEETNARFKYLLEQGQTGLSIAFDLATLMGYDTDQPEALGEFGKCGVAISSLKDMEILLDGIPLEKGSSSMPINSPAAIIWAMYLAAAENKGLRLDQLRGTTQNDILKEFIAQKEFIFPPEPSMRLVVDTMEFGAQNVPQRGFHFALFGNGPRESSLKHRILLGCLSRIGRNAILHDRKPGIDGRLRPTECGRRDRADKYLSPRQCVEGTIIRHLSGVLAEKSVNRSVRAILGNKDIIDKDVMTAGALQTKNVPRVFINRIITSWQKEGAHVWRPAVNLRRHHRSKQNPAAMS